MDVIGQHHREPGMPALGGTEQAFDGAISVIIPHCLDRLHRLLIAFQSSAVQADELSTRERQQDQFRRVGHRRRAADGQTS